MAGAAVDGATNRRGHMRIAPEGATVSRSTDFEVFRRFLAAIAHDFVLDHLPFIESAQSRPLDRGDMNENVLAAALRLNEPVAFGRVEPLHSALRHTSLQELTSHHTARAFRCKARLRDSSWIENSPTIVWNTDSAALFWQSLGRIPCPKPSLVD